MPSIHFIRWVSNLEDSEFELYWFDILNRGEIKELCNVTQFSSWKKRKKNIFKGEYTLSKKAPLVYNYLEPLFSNTIREKLTTIIHQVNPDVVHSFQLKDCSYPILSTMKSFPNLTWIYSCWGSDLFFYQNIKKYKKQIIATLARVNYIHADNYRDYTLAQSLGFKEKLFGVLPGGGGYKIKDIIKKHTPSENRNYILVKGYQHDFGRAIQVLKALLDLKEQISQYKIVIFGAHESIFKYKDKFKEIEIYHRNELNHEELFNIMCKSKIYIGNSTSDGIPNTLLEAMIMGVFPIQSNPGGATAEIIKNRVNGFLIEDPLNVVEIKNYISSALNDNQLLMNAQKINFDYAEEHLDFDLIKGKILSRYHSIIKS